MESKENGWDPEINCANHQENGFIPGHKSCNTPAENDDDITP
jgi:hypothetical protein